MRFTSVGKVHVRGWEGLGKVKHWPGGLHIQRIGLKRTNRVSVTTNGTFASRDDQRLIFRAMANIEVEILGHDATEELRNAVPSIILNAHKENSGDVVVSLSYCGRHFPLLTVASRKLPEVYKRSCLRNTPQGMILGTL